MPDQEIAFLNRPAVMWPFDGYDGVRGQPVVASGVDMLVRWNFNRAEMMDPKRNTVTYDATVLVACEVDVDSIMWPGSTDWLVGTAGPVNQDVYIVKTIAVTHDIKGRATFRQLGLMRYKSKLPAVIEMFFGQCNACLG